VARPFVERVKELLEDLELIDVPLMQVAEDLKGQPLHRAVAQRLTEFGAMTLADLLWRRDLPRLIEPSRLFAAIDSWLELRLATGQPEPEIFSDLAELLSDTVHADLPLSSVLGELNLDQELLRELRAFSVRKNPSVIEFLVEADDFDHWTVQQYRGALVAFRQWAQKVTNNVVQLPTRAVPTGELQSRLDALGIPDLESWYLGQLGNCNPVVRGLTVNQAVARLEPELARLLPGFEAAVKATRALVEPPEVKLPRAGVEALRVKARQARLSIAQPFPLTLATGALQLRMFPSGECQVRFRPHGADTDFAVRTTDLRTWNDAVALRCSCRRELCSHQAATLEFFAFDLHENPEFVETIAEVLTPQWERLLRVLERPGPSAVAASSGSLVFTVSQRGVEARFHSFGKTGLSKKGKALREWHLEGLPEGKERELAEYLLTVRVSSELDDDPGFGEVLKDLPSMANVRWDGEDVAAPVVVLPARGVIDETPTGFEVSVRVGDHRLEKPRVLWRSRTGKLSLHRFPEHIVVAEQTQRSLELLSTLDAFGGSLPKEVGERLARSLPALEKGLQLELPDSLKGTEVPPSTRLLARVSPLPVGVSVELLCEPLSTGAAFTPGAGPSLAAAFDGARRTFTRRDLEAERRVATQFAQSLGLGIPGDDFVWKLEPGEGALAVLQALQASDLQVEWKAPQPRFTREASLDALSLAVTRQKDWFGLEGSVEVDDRRVLLATLLEAARQRRRFVRLGENDYATLSQSLVETLAPLALMGTDGKATSLSIGALPLVAELEQQVKSFEAASEWRHLMQRLADVRDKPFRVPKAMKTELRPYQVEGFEWLSRLSQWCSGAVLADDMGLGKTLQALTLLVARAGEGPALVVAPSSVLHTWKTEAARHAPRLDVRLFDETDRSLDALPKGSVTVVSWTMFAREGARFAERRFATVVFDEAHAMKNANTQRAKAAHELEADFRVALSGTPIENHVGELWSLFRGVMPLLLGSQESFDSRFGRGTKETTKHLATIIRPFILRRTKDAVAKELPPRTDIELLVTLSDEERALYEDVRLAAVTQLGEGVGESKRFDVLAALTRLRLAACHPRLIEAEWKGPTSKLDRLVELVAQLRESGHKVLVFSQFTQHLALVKKALDAEKVTYSYLDGQVAPTERQRRVERFQAGEGGDVFLISLKAGGTGLTLTAADYVVHLDPWWNPAVEDQASDRAHRIGQTRPVTVYRLIAEGTVEQQILSLHRDKRELADALLSGTDVAGKLTAVQLAGLIRDTSAAPLT